MVDDDLNNIWLKVVNSDKFTRKLPNSILRISADKFTRKLPNSMLKFSFKEMSRTINDSKISTIPHISFYRDILKSIDEDTYNKIQDEKEEIIDEEIIEEFTVVHPKFINLAININIYIDISENYIQNDINASEDERKIWKNYIKPFLLFVMTLFFSWGIGNTPITESQFVKQFERVAEVIENYHYPVETTDINIENPKKALE